MLGKYTGSVPNPNISLLLHMDGIDSGTTFTDSSDWGHTVTPNGGITTYTSEYKFGTASANYDGVNEYLSIPDHSAFDFSDGYWSVDCWVMAYPHAKGYLYYQQTDSNNYISIYLLRIGSVYYPVLSIYAGGSEVVSLTSGILIRSSVWTHIEVNEYLNDYRIYVNGNNAGILKDSSRPVDYTGSVFIGCDGSVANVFNGFLDELKIQKHVSHRDMNFTVPTAAYDEDIHIDGAYSANVTNGCWLCGCTNYR